MPMPENKRKRLPFSEDDAASLIQRYDAITVLTLLQEVAHYIQAQPKIDWNDLVKKTTTGISNAREYQMLWRHVAYCHALAESFEDGAEPLDDDSDLECDLEAVPPVNVEAASEAAACVKVMIASRTLNESAPSSSTIEAPLTINLPVCHSSRTPTGNSLPSTVMQGTSVIFPVTVQRQSLPSIPSTEGIQAKGLVGGGNLADKKKRRIVWSEEEDMQLRAAVQRWGEGNWATMAKRDNFPIKRSPHQLSQRWGFLRKRDGSANSGTILSSTQYTTAEQLATRHSLSLALDMPFKKLTAPGMTDPARTTKNQVQLGNTTETSAIRNVPLQRPSQQALSGSGASKLASEKLVPKCNPISDSAVKSVTAASGARADSPSNATSQLKMVHAVEVSTSNPFTRPSIVAGLPSDPKFQLNKHVNPLVSKVPLKQEVDHIKEVVSNPVCTPKEKVKEETPVFAGEKQVDSHLDKKRPREDQDSSMPPLKFARVEEILENKGHEEQGSVKNSNFTKNGSEISQVNKESQTLDQNKKTTSVNGSSDDQSANEKHLNLPIQDKCSQELPR